MSDNTYGRGAYHDQPRVTVSHSSLQEIKDLLRAGKKIQAIKLLRTAAMEHDRPGISLKHAKEGVEKLQGHHNLGPEIVPMCSIIGVRMVCGDGEIDVDLEEASFRVMKDMGKVDIVELRRLLGLLEVLEKFSRGEDSATLRS